MSWSLEFDEPIALPKGKALRSCAMQANTLPRKNCIRRSRVASSTTCAPSMLSRTPLSATRLPGASFTCCANISRRPVKSISGFPIGPVSTLRYSITIFLSGPQWSCVMRASPSIAPEHAGVVYLVLDDLGGKLGRTWRETDEEDTDRETLICDLLDGQYASPSWIVAFNADEGWSRDVTQDIADELWERCAGEAPVSLRDFLDRYLSRPKGQQLKLRL